MKKRVLVDAFIKRIMDESPCESHAHDWAESWLNRNGHIATMLAGGWTLETVQDIPIAELAEKMAVTLWRGESMQELFGGKTISAAPSAPLLTCCLPLPHLFAHTRVWTLWKLAVLLKVMKWIPSMV